MTGPGPDPALLFWVAVGLLAAYALYLAWDACRHLLKRRARGSPAPGAGQNPAPGEPQAPPPPAPGPDWHQWETELGAPFDARD